MARPEERLPENVAGPLYVDATCIDCDTCRRMAPGVYDRSASSGQSFVKRQPEGPAETQRALMALVSCPTASIGVADGVKLDVRDAVRALPASIEADVYECGFTAESSFGAASYLIRRADGNVLVDSPRAAGPLLRAIDALGGVRTLFLTHRDDVADHAAWHAHTKCTRLLHGDDVTRGTRDVERRLEGTDPIVLAPDLVAIPTPGHTRGSACLLYRETFLFTGDHLWADSDTGRLAMGREVCWYSWPEQVRSLERLLDHRFEWVLPGHERPFRAASAAAMKAELERLLRASAARA
jgi:glyoxylase-like metal-dependent hydrolase (beta-lactamase superfamily II)/ferredoxin